MKSALLSRLLMLLAVVAVIGVGCRKIKHNSNSTTVTVTPSQTPKPVAGKGGNASLKITPNHDDLDIDSCKLYIKYDAAVVPFDSTYDDSVWAVNTTGTPVATFSGLKPGNYYLYARGWDLVRSEKVKGGLPFVILEENKNTVHSFVLPIQNY